jgi:prevent-host-death family protein
MALTASQLRADIYNLLDSVIETGTPIEVARKGHVVVITPKEPPSKLSRLVRRDDFIVGSPDDLVHIDWSSEWKP